MFDKEEKIINKDELIKVLEAMPYSKIKFVNMDFVDEYNNITISFELGKE